MLVQERRRVGNRVKRCQHGGCRFERHTCTHARARACRSDRNFGATHKQKEQRNRKEKKGLAQGSLRARQTTGSPHAPEKLTPTPAVNLRVDIHFLAQGLEGKGSLSVAKDVQQPKQFPVDGSRRGDNRRQEGVT